MDLSEAMRSTPATRAFTDRDLPDPTLFEILDDARFAPNGGNRQAWRVVVIRDPEVKSAIGGLYELGFQEYAAQLATGRVPFVAEDAHLRPQPAVDPEAGANNPLPEVESHLAHAPVLLAILLDLRNCSAVDSGLDRLSITAGASVYPFAHNILLAARARGFGGHFTSVLSRQEPALRRLLDFPSHYALATLLPLGEPAKRITKLRREPVESFTTVGSFTGPAFRSPVSEG